MIVALTLLVLTLTMVPVTLSHHAEALPLRNTVTPLSSRRGAAQASIVYALQYGSGLVAPADGSLFVSEDAGTTWEQRRAGYLTSERTHLSDHMEISQIVVHPADPRVLYARASSRGSGVTVYRSEDGGETWEPAAALPPPPGGSWSQSTRSLSGLAPLPGNAGGVLVGVSGHIFITRDGGQSWALLAAPWPVPTELPVTDPWGRSALYQLHWEGSSGETTIFRSNDAGVTWGAVAALSGQAIDLMIAPTIPPTLYVDKRDAGWIAAREGSDSWMPLGQLPAPEGNLPHISGFMIDPEAPSTVYASTYFTPTSATARLPDSACCAIVRSEDGGSTWELLHHGLLPFLTRHIALGAGGTPAVILSMNGSPDVRADRDSTWWASPFFVSHGRADVLWATARDDDWRPLQYPADLTPMLGPVGWVTAVASHLTDPETVYVGRPGGLFKTTDGGARWRAVLTFPAPLLASQLAAARSEPATIYTSARTDSGTLLQRSGDAGRTWTAAPTRLPRDVTSLLVDPLASTTVYAGSGCCPIDDTPPVAIYRTRDAGMTWTAATVQNADTDGLAVRVLVADQSSPGTLYAGLGPPHGVQRRGGVARSTDSGDTWRLLDGLPQCSMIGLAVAPSQSGVIYAAGLCGVFKSLDGGEHWNEAFDPRLNLLNLRPGGSTYGDDFQLLVVVHPTNPDVAYVAVGTQAGAIGSVGGIFRTRDGGATWQETSGGLPEIELPRGGDLYSLTHAAAVALALDPAAPDRLWVSVLGYACFMRGSCSLQTASGVYGSTDGGISWRSTAITSSVRVFVAVAR